MSDWRSGLWLAIRNRILADTGTGGIFNVGTPLVPSAQNVAYGFRGPSTTFPAILFRLVDAATDDTFPAGEFSIDWALEVWVEKNASGVEGHDRANKIVERLHGDELEQGRSSPTFGFHHWAPSTIGGWNFGAHNIVRGFRDLSEQAVVRVVMDCNIRALRAGA